MENQRTFGAEDYTRTKNNWQDLERGKKNQQKIERSGKNCSHPMSPFGRSGLSQVLKQNTCTCLKSWCKMHIRIN